jgi:hypothetical protein
MRTLHIFFSYCSCVGQRANVVHLITVAISAQGTSWVVAVAQAFLVLGSSPQASVRTLPAHTQAIFETPWTLARPRLWDRSPTDRCLLTTSTCMWVRQTAGLLLTCRGVFCPCQACHQNPWASLAELVRAGVRASQGALCVLLLSFGTLCATIQIATMRCMDLHSFWNLYASTPWGFRSISINSRPFCKGCIQGFHVSSVDLCPP